MWAAAEVGESGRAPPADGWAGLARLLIWRLGAQRSPCRIGRGSAADQPVGGSACPRVEPAGAREEGVAAAGSKASQCGSSVKNTEVLRSNDGGMTDALDEPAAPSA